MKKLLLLLSLVSSQVFANWDGATRGEIRAIEVTAAENYGFRIHLKENPALCGNSNTWAFINKSDSNYEVYVSLLTAAKFANAKVIIYTNRLSNGYCRIGHIGVE